MRIEGGGGAIWLKGKWTFDIGYEATVTDDVDGKNSLVNEYKNSQS